MKSFASCFVLLALVLMASLVCAAPGGKVVIDPNNKTLPYHSPDPASAVCTTTTTTKGTIATVNVAGYSTLSWEASDSSNAAKRIRRFINSNTAYLPGTGGTIGLNSKMSTVAFKPYSGTSAAYTVCYDLQSGGKTP